MLYAYEIVPVHDVQGGLRCLLPLVTKLRQSTLDRNLGVNEVRSTALTSTWDSATHRDESPDTATS